MKKIYLLLVFCIMLGLGFNTQVFAVKHIITQSGLTFNPFDLNEVMVGDTIRWVWTGGFHTTTSSEIPAEAMPWDHILSSGSQFFEYKVMVPGDYYYVCSPHIELGMVGVFHVAGPSGNTINGTISYNNAGATGLPNTTVRLLDISDNQIGITTTNNAGAYTFNNIPDGTYSLSVLTSVSWGGVNATDALAALKHFVNLNLLTGLRLKAADVDNSGFINSLDALAISRRFVGITNSFISGDWYFQPISVNVSGNTTTLANVQGICFGDADGSYSSFGNKQSPLISVVSDQRRMFRPGQVLSIPVSLEPSVSIGALSLVIPFPESAFSLLEVSHTSGTGNLLYTQNNGELRISWFSAEPITALAGIPIILLSLKASSSLESGFIWNPEVRANSEIADEEAHPIPDLRVRIPQLKSTLAAVKHVITQSGLTFSPDEVPDVKIGDTIQWVWTSGVHTATSSNIPAGAASWDAPLTSVFPSYTYIATVLGDHNYVCTPHISLGMVGKFVVEDTPSGIEGMAMENRVVSIFPNPVYDHQCNITFTSPSAGDVEIRVYNMLGTMVTNTHVQARKGVNKASVDVNAVSEGVYFVQLWESGAKMTTQKIIKR